MPLPWAARKHRPPRSWESPHAKFHPVHDRADGEVSCDGLPRGAAWAKFEELLACAPFMLSERDALDFRLKLRVNHPA